MLEHTARTSSQVSLSLRTTPCEVQSSGVIPPTIATVYPTPLPESVLHDAARDE